MDETKTVIFTRKREDEELHLKLYGRIVERVQVFSFSGMFFFFYSKLTWRTHITKTRGKCKKVINVMRCLTETEWGADRCSMKTVWVGLVRSVLDYW